MMKLTKKLFIASLSVAMVCSLFAGAFSFGGNSVKADESPAGAITYKLSEELSKITYTAEELTAFNAAHYPNGDGWNGTYGKGDVDAKAAFLKTVFEKSAIEVYSGFNSAYNAKHYYEWAGDGNSYRYSYVAVNGVGAGNWNGGLASNLNGTANNMGVYAGKHYERNKIPCWYWLRSNRQRNLKGWFFKERNCFNHLKAHRCKT